MRQNIPQTGNAPPGNLRVTLTNVVGNLFGRFAKEFEISQNSVIDKFIVLKISRVHSRRVSRHLAAETLHVMQEQRPLSR